MGQLNSGLRAGLTLGDLTCTLPGYDSRASRDPKLSAESLLQHAALYANPGDSEQANPKSRLSCPILSTLILVGDDEVLLDDSKLAFELISQHQSDCTLSIFASETHVWVMDNIASSASVRALASIVSHMEDAAERNGHKS